MATERRKHERHDQEKLLEIFDRSSGELLGRLANISQQGAMFITDTPVKSQDNFKCRVKLARKILARDELIFDAECRWCRKNIDKDRWESGYSLTMSKFDSELLNFLELSFKLGDLGESDLVEADVTELMNRRHSERYNLKQMLPVFELKSYHQIGHLIDLSTGGAKLKTRARLTVGETIHFRILLNHSTFQQEYLHFSAKCCWCRKRESGEFDSGYQIEKISETDSAILLHLLIHESESINSSPRFEIA